LIRDDFDSSIRKYKQILFTSLLIVIVILKILKLLNHCSIFLLSLEKSTFIMDDIFILNPLSLPRTSTFKVYILVVPFIDFFFPLSNRVKKIYYSYKFVHWVKSFDKAQHALILIMKTIICKIKTFYQINILSWVEILRRVYCIECSLVFVTW
jgi:hypothetical protein